MKVKRKEPVYTPYQYVGKAVQGVFEQDGTILLTQPWVKCCAYGSWILVDEDGEIYQYSTDAQFRKYYQQIEE